MKNATDILGISFVTEETNLLRKCLKHTISSWMRRPMLSMVEMLCAGCRLSLIRGTHKFAQRNSIPIIINGGTPFENMIYREEIMGLGSTRNKFSAILQYLSRVTKNPRWIMSYRYIVTQIREYYYWFYYRKIARKAGILRIAPFENYIRWKEKEVISTIEHELDWMSNPTVESSWRGDCDIASLKLYLYKQVLGFNDKDVILSNLIRDGQVDRQEALERLDKEGEIPEETIRYVLDNIGIGHSDFTGCVARLIESHTNP
jgi:hypothetical protein